MNWDAVDLRAEWNHFTRHCDFVFKCRLNGKTEAQKVNCLMTFVGDKGREIYTTFTFQAAKVDRLDPLYD